jgi:hypothetical protein
VTLSQVYTRAHGYHDVLALRVPLVARRFWFLRVNLVAVVVAAHLEGHWVGWLGEASWKAGAAPTLAFGPAETRAKLAQRLAINAGEV